MVTPYNINIQSSPYDTPGRVYNGPPVVNVPRHYIFPLPNQTPPAPSTPVPTNVPVVLTDLFATPADLATNVTVVVQNGDTVPRMPITGCFTAVRARRLLHQFRIGFWTTAGIIDQLTASSASDPTTDQASTAWNNFQIFSYLPTQLMPTQQQFNDLITPSKQAANVQAALPSMGINIATSNNPLAAAPPANPAPPLPDPTPFASNLSQFCAIAT